MLSDTARECIYKKEISQDAELIFVSLIFQNSVFLLFKFWVKYIYVLLLLNLSFCNHHWDTCRVGASAEIHVLFTFVVAFLLILSRQSKAFMLHRHRRIMMTSTI